MIKKIFKTSRSSTSRELSGRRGMQTVTIDTGNRFVPKQLPVIHDQRIRTFGRIGKNRMLRINLDITDYMRTKELKEQRDEMEQSCRLYVASQTAAAIAHELNQPLTAISYYADVALHLLNTDKQNPQKLAHILENCALQAQRAGEVIRQLLAHIHKEETSSEPIDINMLVQEAVAYVKADIHLGTFKIEQDLAASLSSVLVNRLQIQKVLITLLRNGLESMQESETNTGAITVTSRIADNDPGIVRVTVCDCGKGVIDTATLVTMFKPFHTTKASGLGMGLAISRALIEAHGGQIWAEQNTDVGISVHLTLPFAA
jgi:C4-dicarboxylate-specific signal transduction histidine kinase